jgi:adenosylhomocysteine nucleosidase
MKILAVAALALELKPWLRRCQSLKRAKAGRGLQPSTNSPTTPSATESVLREFIRLDWPLSYAYKAQWNGATLYAVANGPGPRLATHALQTAIEQAGPFDGLMSIGLCGALNTNLPLNTVCTATEVGDGQTTWPAQPILNAAALKILSIDRFLGHPAEKQKWAEKGFDIVEMEAAPIAEYAAANNIPFRAVKVVSDLAVEHFALDFNQYRDQSGRFSNTRIALAALAHPIRYTPGLYRLASRGPSVSETLGVFLADSRF